MGLKEHIRAGANLTRDGVTIIDSLGSGSVSLGGTYGILSVVANQPCRLRLYDNLNSRDDVLETNRVFSSVSNVSSSVALVGDFSMSAAGTYTIDPMLFGHAHNGQNTYYRIEPAGGTVTINRYLLENFAIQPKSPSPYITNNRRTITITPTSSLAALQIYGDELDDSSVPKTYLLVSASLSNAYVARLRLYSTNDELDDSTEKNRAFDVEPSASTHLIADMFLTGSSTFYFTPKIIGANLQSIGAGADLTSLIGNQNNLTGQSKLYYFLQNASSSGLPQTPTVNLYVYSLQD